MTIQELFYSNTGRVSDKWANYLPVYDRFFYPYKDKIVNLLEIGVQNGGALGIYAKYFHPESNIVGVDMDAQCKAVEEGNIKIFIGSQSDSAFMESIPYKFDIIFDDGSHIQSDLKSTFNTMFPLLNNGGIYIVEDLHTSYWEGHYQGGLQKEGTFIEYAKKIIDDLHSYHITQPYTPSVHRNHIRGIYVADSIIVIEKNDTLITTPVARVKSGSLSIFPKT